ncbi:MAG TPA: polysaccharide pyruvyl transferase family protein [Tepidisphaeraceae bacterium]|nr:polysaccharide pyruvyl transferase family protein [Tepidisphaeraceae bacterium]
MRYLVDGCYGDGNVGDEALLRAVIVLLRRADADAKIEALSSSPSATTSAHGIRAIHRAEPLAWTIYGALLKAQLWRVIRAIMRCDCFILGGGELFRDDVGIVALLEMFYPLFLARLLGKPVISLGVGAQEPTTSCGRWLITRALFACDTIVFRDARSVDIAENLTWGQRRFVSAADVVFTLAREPRAPVARVNSGQDHVTIAIALKGIGDRFMGAEGRARLVQAIQDAIVSLSKSRAISVVALAFGEDDVHPTVSLSKSLSQHGINCNVNSSLDLDNLANAIRGVDCMIAMPLHASIFAMSSGVPSIGLAYDLKVEKLYRQARLEPFCFNAAHVDAAQLHSALCKILTDHHNVTLDLGRYVATEQRKTLALVSDALSDARRRMSAGSQSGSGELKGCAR